VELSAGVEQPRAHCGRRDLEGARRFLGGQPLELDEDEDRPLLRAQMPEGALGDLAVTTCASDASIFRKRPAPRV
jgi:hypothetical protein